MHFLKRCFKPEIYQGSHHNSRYFEGWFFKLTDADANHCLSIIPGVSFDQGGKDAHAFIQVNDTANNRSEYFKFNLSDCKFSSSEMYFSIKKNVFSQDGLKLDLNGKNAMYKGEIKFNNSIPYPRRRLHPGIMGPFSFVPFMECNHSVIHVRHELSGGLWIDGKPYDFTNGIGYIEKDWGTSFPQEWVWLQCNHFDSKDADFMLSCARIPWLGRSFKGLISFLRVGEKFYRLATYTGAKTTSLVYEKNELFLQVESRSHVLSVTVQVKPGLKLMAPKHGKMVTNIKESLTSEMELYLLQKNGKLIYKGNGRMVGVELSGDLNELYHH